MRQPSRGDDAHPDARWRHAPVPAPPAGHTGSARGDPPRAAQLALAQRERTPEQIIEDGRVALERARKEAVLSGQAIAEEAEAARDD